MARGDSIRWSTLTSDFFPQTALRITQRRYMSEDSCVGMHFAVAAPR